MGTQRTATQRIAGLTLGWLAVYGCGRTELDATLDLGSASLKPTGGTSSGQGGSVQSTSWNGGTSAVPSSTQATGGLATGGHVASGGTTPLGSTKASGGLTSGGYVATGGVSMVSATSATGGLATGGYVATGGVPVVHSTNTIGGQVAGGSVASGGATIATGGSLVTGSGGTLATGGSPTIYSSGVSSWRATYQCPAKQPNALDPCECDEMPCICTYSSFATWLGDVCSQGRIVCEAGGGSEYACLSGTWRLVGGGGGSGCFCGDPNAYFGTGGAPSTGGASATGGTSAISTGTALGGASSTGGGTSSNTAPVITSTGGSYSCPTAEPYGAQQAPCNCTDPPCECYYTYTWTEDSYCADAATCEQSLSFDYTCQDGLWQGSGPDWSTGCACDTGDAGT